MPTYLSENPLKVLSQTISKELLLKLDLRGVSSPGGVEINEDQRLTDSFKVGWSKLSNVSLIESHDSVFRVDTISYEVSLSFKDVKLTDIAQDFLFQTLMILGGFRPYYLFDPLLPVTCGYVSYDDNTKFIKYAATFNTGFEWTKNAPPVLTPIEDLTGLEYWISLQLWNSRSFTTGNEVKDYDSETT